jgi:hypothetical protein
MASALFPFLAGTISRIAERWPLADWPEMRAADL